LYSSWKKEAAFEAEVRRDLGFISNDFLDFRKERVTTYKAAPTACFSDFELRGRQHAA
jgi:hypothetical protein